MPFGRLANEGPAFDVMLGILFSKFFVGPHDISDNITRKRNGNKTRLEFFIFF